MTTTRLALTRPLCVLWRTDGRLQLGLDADTALVLADAPPGIDAVLRALRIPRTPLEVARLVPMVPRAILDRVLGTLVASGHLTERVAGRPPVVSVLGDGPIAAAVVDLLERDGHDVRASVRATTDACGVVVACPATAEPDRVLTRDLTAAGLPHLVARAEPERAVVGPFVVPGRSACVACTDLVRREFDPDWPHLLAQLCRSIHVPGPLQTAWAAALASTQVAAWHASGEPEAAGATLELDAHTGALGARRWPRHPDCGCQLAAA